MILKNYWAQLLVIFLVIPSFISMLRPGFFPIQDDMQAFRIQQMVKCFQDGQIPCRWIPDGGYQYGYPLFNFYAPSVYYLGGLIHLVGFQIIDTLKILFVFGFVFSALSMFVLAREFAGKWPAIIASVLYTYAPFRAAEVYVRGAIGEFWAFVFFPLLFWSSYKLINDGKNKQSLIFADAQNKYLIYFMLSLAGIILTHNLLSVGFSIALALWIAYWLLVRRSKIAIFKITCGVVVGVLLSSFFLLPAFFEKQFVHIETLLGGYFDYRQHFVTFKQIFFSNNWGYGSSQLGPDDDLALSTGIIHWVVGALAGILAVINLKRKKEISILVLTLLSLDLFFLFLTHQKSSFIWEKVGVLPWFQFPWRFLAISTFLLAFLSSFLIGFLGRSKYVVGVIILILTFVFYGNFFHPKTWADITDQDKFSGGNWEKALTASIFDYLPIYAEKPPDNKAPDLPEVINGEVRFLDYKKASDYQTGRLEIIRSSTIRLPLYDFPGMEVYLDGKVIRHRHNECANQTHCLGLITFDAEKGERMLWVGLKDTPVRKLGNILSVVSVLVIFYLIYGIKRRHNATS
ncbi:MAG: hypothetical protein Q7S60_01280 [bacterium]|nr:hypothetical protein [bacterium]